MTVLYRKEQQDYYPWSSGSTALLTDNEDCGHKMIISIKCSFGESADKHYALFDTGARYTVVAKSIADLYPDAFFSFETKVEIHSRHGYSDGILHLCNFRILADFGTDIFVDCNVLVVPDWQGPIVIGFTSLLDRIRWACDPTISNQGRLYFGVDF